MGYLVLARHEGETIILRAAPGSDPDALHAQLLEGGITIALTELDGKRAKIGIEAPLSLQILRSELEGA